MTEKMKTAVVILNWNGKKFLEQFLAGVVKHSEGDADVIVADNGSTDDSIAWLQSNFPEVRIIKIAENKGFTGGYNEALKQIDAEYFVLLNSDIEVTEGWIKPVVALMDSDLYVAACQPKILSFAERRKFEYAGAAGGYIDWLGYPFCRGRIFEEIEEDQGQYDDSREVFWATGACMFVRAKTFHELGGFDENFFAHMEEIDLCWRMKNAGHKVFYCGGSKIYHVGGGTLHKSNPHKTFLNFRNNLLLLINNLPTEKLLPILLLRFFLDGTAAIRFSLKGNFPDAFAVFRAWMEVMLNFFRKWKKKNAHYAQVSGIYQNSIVVEYYLRGKKKFPELDMD